MRFDTHKVRTYLVNHLNAAQGVDDVWDDGSDVVLATLRSGLVVSMHIIERPITLAELKATLQQNNAAGFHTLFAFWCDLLLPREGDRYPLDDWMAALLPLYDDVLVGYEVFREDVFVFPVHFEGTGGERVARYGKGVNFGT